MFTLDIASLSVRLKEITGRNRKARDHLLSLAERIVANTVESDGLVDAIDAATSKQSPFSWKNIGGKDAKAAKAAFKTIVLENIVDVPEETVVTESEPVPEPEERAEPDPEPTVEPELKPEQAKEEVAIPDKAPEPPQDDTVAPPDATEPSASDTLTVTYKRSIEAYGGRYCDPEHGWIHPGVPIVRSAFVDKLLRDGDLIEVKE